jgi:hypothetical protein
MLPWLSAAALCPVVLLVVARAHAQTLPVSAPGSPFFAPQPALLARVENEHVVTLDTAAVQSADDRVKVAEALVLFEQPLATVLQLLASTSRQTEYRPELQSLHIVKATEQSNLAEYQLRFMLRTLRYRARTSWDLERGRIWWSLDPSFPNQLKTLDGLWELRALDARRTLGHMSIRMDLGPALPGALQDYATREKLPEAVDQVRRWVDSSGR